MKLTLYTKDQKTVLSSPWRYTLLLSHTLDNLKRAFLD